MIPWIAIAIYFLFSTLLSLLIGLDAQKRGLKTEEVYGWAGVTFIFSLLALLLYLAAIVPRSTVQMFCPKCGKKIQIDWKHCPYCGYEFKREQH